MNPETIEKIRTILETDRIWSGYAIVDLEPEYVEQCEWIVGNGAVILLYRGLELPILFAQGEPKEISELAAGIEQGDYAYTLTGTFRAALLHRLDIASEERMWRMALQKRRFAEIPQEAHRLGAGDHVEIDELLAEHADRPDAYHRGQLASGVFYGVRHRNKLVSMAGTHVISKNAQLAAVGNVFTHPTHRKRGYGQLVSEAVLAELYGQSIEMIILNVGMNNQPAVKMYQNLGFMPYCGYYEGKATVLPS
jgi:GNAT superfamily N-acetyltransferase